MIIIVATFGQAVSGNGFAVGIIGVLVVWRFLVRLHGMSFEIDPYRLHSDGGRRWRRLSAQCYHLLRVRVDSDPRTRDDGCVCCPGLGELQFVHQVSAIRFE
jgi:hypothetical protein